MCDGCILTTVVPTAQTQFGWVSIQSARADEEAARRCGRQRPEESEVSDGNGFGGSGAGGEEGEEAVAETREAQETQLLVRT